MALLALFLVLLSALLHSFWNFFTKKGEDKQIFVWCSTVVALILFSPFFLYFIMRTSIPQLGWWLLAISGLLEALYFISLGEAYREGDLSLAYPLARSAPIFVLLWAVLFLKEKLSLLGVGGIVLVCFGVYILHLERFSLPNLSQPIKLLRSRTSRWALLTAIFTSFYSIVDKIGVKYVHVFLYLYVMHIFLLLFLSFYIFLHKETKEVKMEWQRNKKTISAAGTFCILEYFLTLMAMTLSKVSYVISVKQFSIVFGVILGNLVLKERYGKIRLPASLIICAGIVLIGLAK